MESLFGRPVKEFRVCGTDFMEFIDVTSGKVQVCIGLAVESSFERSPFETSGREPLEDVKEVARHLHTVAQRIAHYARPGGVVNDVDHELAAAYLLKGLHTLLTDRSEPLPRFPEFRKHALQKRAALKFQDDSTQAEIDAIKAEFDAAGANSDESPAVTPFLPSTVWQLGMFSLKTGEQPADKNPDALAALNVLVQRHKTDYRVFRTDDEVRAVLDEVRTRREADDALKATFVELLRPALTKLGLSEAMEIETLVKLDDPVVWDGAEKCELIVFTMGTGISIFAVPKPKESADKRDEDIGKMLANALRRRLGGANIDVEVIRV